MSRRAIVGAGQALCAPGDEVAPGLSDAREGTTDDVMRGVSAGSGRVAGRALAALRPVVRSPAVRVAGSLVGLAILLHAVRVSSLLHDARTADLRWLGVGLALSCVGFLAGVVQWGVLLRGGGTGTVSWRSVASWEAQSIFACHVLPSPVAGDTVRAVSASRARGAGAGLGSILASRLASGLAMSLWGLAGAVALRGVFGPSGLVAGAIGVAVVAAIWIVALGASRLGRRLEPLRAMRSVIRGGRVVVCMLVAAAAWGVQLLALQAFGRAVGIHASITLFAVAVPISLLATWAPVSVNGVGLREGVLAGVLVHAGIGAGSAGALSLLVDVQMVPIALGGALVWMCARRRGAEDVDGATGERVRTAPRPRRARRGERVTSPGEGAVCA